MNLTNQPIISFIIPVYNVESFLDQCLQSIIDQSISKEIIIIDDGSTDKSLSIALNYTKQYSYITVVHTTNKGAAFARNKGLKLAAGEYISFIDADDYLIGNMVPLIEKAKQYSADLIKIKAISYESTNKTYIEFIDILENNQIITGFELLQKMYESNYWIPGVCWTLISKKYLDKYQIKFKEGVIAEDQLFYIQLLTSSPKCILINLPSVEYIYRQNNPLSVSKRKDHDYVADHLRIISFIWEYLIKQPKSIQPSIFYVTQKILWTVVSIISKWSATQLQQFPYFYHDDWKQVLTQYYPNHWEHIESLYNKKA